MGKVVGAGLIVSGIAVLFGASLLPHQKAGPVDHEAIPMSGGPFSVDRWGLFRVKTEEPIVITLPSHPRPINLQLVPALNPH